MTERKAPLKNRFPGQSVARFQFWLTDGSRVMLEGPFATEAITQAFSALLRGCQDDDGARLHQNSQAEKVKLP